MSDDPNLNLGPPQIVRDTSLEADEKAMKKGNTWVLAAAIVAGLAVVAGIVFVLAREDPNEQYRAIGRQVNAMKGANFDAFWVCALPNQALDRLRSDQDLRAAINERAASRPRAYGQHVRQRCMVKLTEHASPLATLIPPDDLREPLTELGNAVEDLEQAWVAYIAHLERVETYDADAAGAQLTAIARGWYDYKRVHGDINRTIREHLNE